MCRIGGKVVVNEAGKAVKEKAITPSANAEVSPEVSATLPESPSSNVVTSSATTLPKQAKSGSLIAGGQTKNKQGHTITNTNSEQPVAISNADGSSELNGLNTISSVPQRDPLATLFPGLMPGIHPRSFPTYSPALLPQTTSVIAY